MPHSRRATHPVTNRPAGGARSQKWERADFDWYVEPALAVEQLMAAIDFGDDMIWDGCCGRGTVLDVAKARGHWTIGSDIVDRFPRHKFYRGNILNATRWPNAGDRALSYISNPPYSYEDDIAERIIRKVLSTFPVRRAAFILPIAFLASGGRWRFFMRDCKPSHVAIYSERHTMPPGAMIDEMGDSAFKGGMQDYCAVVYTAPMTARWRTETIWLEPSE